MAASIEDLLRAYQRVVHLPWDTSLAPAQKIWMAVYDKKQEHRLRFRIDEFKTANLAVLPAARGPAVLALYPDRLRAFLKETGLVHDQHAVRIAEILSHVGLQVVTHTIRVPLRRIERPLHPPCGPASPSCSASCQPFLRSTRASSPSR
jgi:hypothetical protein